MMFWGRGVRRGGLHRPRSGANASLPNASAALAALDARRARLPVGMQDIRNGFAHVELPARFQVLPADRRSFWTSRTIRRPEGVLAENSRMGF